MLQAGDPSTPIAPGAMHESWAFVLLPEQPGTTRLIVRNRRTFRLTAGAIITWWVVTEPLHFVMEQKLLRSVKARAERGGS